MTFNDIIKSVCATRAKVDSFNSSESTEKKTGRELRNLFMQFIVRNNDGKNRCIIKAGEKRVDYSGEVLQSFVTVSFTRNKTRFCFNAEAIRDIKPWETGVGMSIFTLTGIFDIDFDIE